MTHKNKSFNIILHLFNSICALTPCFLTSVSPNFYSALSFLPKIRNIFLVTRITANILHIPLQNISLTLRCYLVTLYFKQLKLSLP
jgi:uncharacterized membrane protein YdjX (TVP38/TMEM64 family)